MLHSVAVSHSVAQSAPLTGLSVGRFSLCLRRAAHTSDLAIESRQHRLSVCVCVWGGGGGGEGGEHTWGHGGGGGGGREESTHGDMGGGGGGGGGGGEGGYI